jgi:hypothetical protein
MTLTKTSDNFTPVDTTSTQKESLEHGNLVKKLRPKTQYKEKVVNTSLEVQKVLAQTHLYLTKKPYNSSKIQISASSLINKNPETRFK